MKRLVWLGCFGIMAATLHAADAVKPAAQALAAKANYTWSTISKQENSDQGFTMKSEGKTEKDGCSLVTVSFGDRSSEVAIKGTNVAVKQEEDWKAASELEGRGAFMVRRYQAFKAPAAEAEDLAAKAKELKAGADGLYTGDLTEQGAKDLLSRNRRGGGQNNTPAPEPKDAKGSVKFWVKDGVLVKFEFNVQGKVAGRDQNETQVNRTTTTDIKDVGTTKVTLPDAAKKKLGIN